MLAEYGLDLVERAHDGPTGRVPERVRPCRVGDGDRVDGACFECCGNLGREHVADGAGSSIATLAGPDVGYDGKRPDVGEALRSDRRVRVRVDLRQLVVAERQDPGACIEVRLELSRLAAFVRASRVQCQNELTEVGGVESQRP